MTQIYQLKSVLDNTDILAMKTGALYDKTIVQGVASTLKSRFGDGIPGLVCDPVCHVSTSTHTAPKDSTLETVIDEILPLATLVTSNKFQAEHILSLRGQNVEISSLADMVPASKKLLDLGPKAVLLRGGHIKTTMTEVHELLEGNPDMSVYKYGLLEENMNILKVELSEEDRIPHPVVDVLRISSGPGGEAKTSIFIRPRISSGITRGKGRTLSAAIVCGLAKRLTSNSLFFLFFSGLTMFV